MKPFEERFWDNVNKTFNCWEWMTSTTYGYGQTFYKGKNSRAHRVSWELTYGEIPDGLCVLHKCDNPRCVNPDHLFLGTQKDNIHDMMRKGRKPIPVYLRGEDSHLSKLTWDKVDTIRRLNKSQGIKAPTIAKMFNVTKQTIYYILKGHTWHTRTG